MKPRLRSAELSSPHHCERFCSREQTQYGIYPGLALTVWNIKDATLAALATAVALWYITASFTAWFRLRNFPGPTLASFSYAWVFLKMRTGQMHRVAVETQRRYGPIVRIGPQRVARLRSGNALAHQWPTLRLCSRRMVRRHALRPLRSQPLLRVGHGAARRAQGTTRPRFYNPRRGRLRGRCEHPCCRASRSSRAEIYPKARASRPGCGL